MRAGVIVQARMGSRRLPGKVLREVGGTPLLGLLLERLGRAEGIDEVVLNTSDCPDDDPVAAFGASAGVRVHRGPLDDVLGRVVGACHAARLDVAVRVSGDSPLLDQSLVERAVRMLGGGGWDAVSNVVRRTFPPGQSVEALTRDALDRLDRLATDPADREHVTPLLYRFPDRFRVASIERDPPVTLPHLAVDTQEDLDRMDAMVRRMGRPQWMYGLDDLLLLAATP